MLREQQQFYSSRGAPSSGDSLSSSGSTSNPPRSFVRFNIVPATSSTELELQSIPVTTTLPKSQLNNSQNQSSQNPSDQLESSSNITQLKQPANSNEQPNSQTEQDSDGNGSHRVAWDPQIAQETTEVAPPAPAPLMYVARYSTIFQHPLLPQPPASNQGEIFPKKIPKQLQNINLSSTLKNVQLEYLALKRDRHFLNLQSPNYHSTSSLSRHLHDNQSNSKNNNNINAHNSNTNKGVDIRNHTNNNKNSNNNGMLSTKRDVNSFRSFSNYESNEVEKLEARENHSEFMRLLKNCGICSESEQQYATKQFGVTKKLKSVRILLSNPNTHHWTASTNLSSVSQQSAITSKTGSTKSQGSPLTFYDYHRIAFNKDSIEEVEANENKSQTRKNRSNLNENVKSAGSSVRKQFPISRSSESSPNLLRSSKSAAQINKQIDFKRRIKSIAEGMPTNAHSPQFFDRQSTSKPMMKVVSTSIPTTRSSTPLLHKFNLETRRVSHSFDRSTATSESTRQTANQRNGNNNSRSSTTSGSMKRPLKGILKQNGMMMMHSSYSQYPIAMSYAEGTDSVKESDTNVVGQSEQNRSRQGSYQSQSPAARSPKSIVQQQILSDFSKDYNKSYQTSATATTTTTVKAGGKFRSNPGQKREHLQQSLGKIMNDSTNRSMVNSHKLTSANAIGIRIKRSPTSRGEAFGESAGTTTSKSIKNSLNLPAGNSHFIGQNSMTPAGIVSGVQQDNSCISKRDDTYLHDEYSSGDESIASAIEAQLDNCYDRSIRIQRKIIGNDTDISLKIKNLLRIESLSKEIRVLTNRKIKQ